MNEAVVSEAGSALQRFTERNPHIGIFASVAGFTTSIVSAVHVLSIFIGLLGAVFGCIAGYYTMRCHYRKWHRALEEDAAKRDDEERARDVRERAREVREQAREDRADKRQ